MCLSSHLCSNCSWSKNGRYHLRNIKDANWASSRTTTRPWKSPQNKPDFHSLTSTVPILPTRRTALPKLLPFRQPRVQCHQILSPINMIVTISDHALCNLLQHLGSKFRMPRVAKVFDEARINAQIRCVLHDKLEKAPAQSTWVARSCPCADFSHDINETPHHAFRP